MDFDWNLTPRLDSFCNCVILPLGSKTFSVFETMYILNINKHAKHKNYLFVQTQSNIILH